MPYRCRSGTLHSITLETTIDTSNLRIGNHLHLVPNDATVYVTTGVSGVKYGTTLGKWDKGDPVCDWQDFLISQGYRFKSDGYFGDDIVKGTKLYRRSALLHRFERRRAHMLYTP